MAEILTCVHCRLFSGQSPPESPWGPLTWRSLLAKALCCHARLPAIQLWMSLSRGHSMASTWTSRETAIISNEWAGWVISSVQLILAFLVLIGTYYGMYEGALQCPAEGFLGTSNTQAEEYMPRLALLKSFSVIPGGRKNKMTQIFVKNQLHFFNSHAIRASISATIRSVIGVLTFWIGRVICHALHF